MVYCYTKDQFINKYRAVRKRAHLLMLFLIDLLQSFIGIKYSFHYAEALESALAIQNATFMKSAT